MVNVFAYQFETERNQNLSFSAKHRPHEHGILPYIQTLSEEHTFRVLNGPVIVQFLRFLDIIPCSCNVQNFLCLTYSLLVCPDLSMVSSMSAHYLRYFYMGKEFQLILFRLCHEQSVLIHSVVINLYSAVVNSYQNMIKPFTQYHLYDFNGKIILTHTGFSEHESWCHTEERLLKLGSSKQTCTLLRLEIVWTN